MRRTIVLATFAAVIGSAVSTGAAADRVITARLSARVRSVASWCCGDIQALSGRAVVRGIGPVSFDGQYTDSVNPYLTFDQERGYVRPYGESRSLQVTLRTAKGDALVLAGEASWSQADRTPARTWSIASATGRFLGLSGSGTYVYSRDGTTATLSLRGSIG